MRGLVRCLSGLLALSVSLSGGLYLPVAQAQATVASRAGGLQPVRTLEGIREYKLDNGLKVLLFPDSSKPTVTVNITYLVGSRQESYGETGMAHLLEHLQFKGTPTHPNIPQLMQERGAEFNASTWYDRTNYHETLAGNDRNLEFALKLEADRMTNSYIRRSDLDSEMTVVRNEFEAGENDAADILNERVFSTAYLWHSYGRATIGARSDIEKVTIPSLQAFYKKYYQPDNAVLVIAGRFDEAKAKAMIEQYFGPIPKPSRVLAEPYTEEPPQDGERVVTLRRVGQVQVLGLLYHIPQAAHPDLAAIQVLDAILTAAPSGRLYKALVETQKATRVGGGAFLLHDPGAYYLSVTVPKNKSLSEVKAITDRVMQEVLSKGVTAEEVKRAQIAQEKDDTDTFNDSQGLAIQLSEWTAMGDWRLFFVNRDRIQKVTPKDVQRVARAYFTPVNRTLGYYYPTTKPERVAIPNDIKVASIADGYVPRKDVAAGETFDLSAANLLQRSVRTKLPGGLDVTLIPKKNRGETVVAQITLFLGTRQEVLAQKHVNSYVAAMLNRGTTTLTRQQLKDKFDALKAQVSIGGAATRTVISIQTIRPNLPEVLKLVGKMLREPAFDPKEFALIKQQSLTALEAQRTDPQQLAFDRVSLDTFKPDTINFPGTLEERTARVKSLEVAQLKSFYKTFYGATAGAAAVVGDFDPEPLKAALTATLGDWRAPKPGRFIPPTSQELAQIKSSSEVITVPDKPNATFVAALPMLIGEDDPQFTALEAGVYILGGGTLSSRFADRVRQKDGFSYSAGSSINTSSRADYSILFNSAISNNENAPKVEQAFKEELKRLLDQGITAEELKRTQDALIQEQVVGLSDDGNLAAVANDLIVRGKTFQELADQESRIRALTVEEVNAALRKYIAVDQLRIVKAGDLPKTGG
ncbi:M16 family metallopeptidase [Anthocerotibacter panamensis]|uniref:M16 family metallopeptidase n=1 Tax=Anthocerotibacter panamensis TaxID=2857077 RepID=UPI001C403FED|nr:pitrilysin family protein [Anthocerotibacter panamensis]